MEHEGLEHRQVQSGGARLQVDIHQPTSQAAARRRPPIVALHPGVGDRRFWAVCAQGWADAGHVVIAYDRRGFGETTAPPEPHDDLADLCAVMDATVTGPAVVVGNSRGGILALDLARSQPERLSAAVLVGSSGTGVPIAEEDWPLSEAEDLQDQLIAAAEEQGDLEEVNRMEARYWLDGTDQPEGRVGGTARELFLDANGRALRAGDLGEATAHPPTWPDLPELTIPVLMIAGEHDLPGLVLSTRMAAEQIPGASFTVMEDTAHCPSLDQPDELRTLVLRFLAERGV